MREQTVNIKGGDDQTSPKNTRTVELTLVFACSGKIDRTADSWMSLIADGNQRDTFLGRNIWKRLIGSQASLQCNCNMEGFNVVGTVQWSRARIGILGNSEKDCSNCDSRIGFGTGGKHDNSSTCGNPAGNGARHIKAMGFILIQ